MSHVHSFFFSLVFNGITFSVLPSNTMLAVDFGQIFFCNKGFNLLNQVSTMCLHFFLQKKLRSKLIVIKYFIVSFIIVRVFCVRGRDMACYNHTSPVNTPAFQS